MQPKPNSKLKLKKSHNYAPHHFFHTVCMESILPRRVRGQHAPSFELCASCTNSYFHFVPKRYFIFIRKSKIKFQRFAQKFLKIFVHFVQS